MISSSPHLESEHHWNINNFWSCILGKEGIAQIFELILELLTAVIGRKTKYNIKTTDSKIIDIANCKTFKK